MVVTGQVKHAVHHGLLEIPRAGRADDDVAQLAGARRRPVLIDRKREHVRLLVAATERPVQLPDAGGLDQLDMHYQAFIGAFATAEPRAPQEVFVAQTSMVHQWRKFPFLDPGLPEQAFKVYAPQTVGCLADEYHAYQRLGGSPYFAACLGHGAFYLVLSYEAGPTLYECLVRGIPVPARAMADVEAARAYARSVGLHPKDVHLKNVLLQGDRARILDVSKYVAPGDEDRVWDLLAEGYRRVYPLLRGRPVPVWLIELVKRRYKARIKGRQAPNPPSTAITCPVT